jgi:heat shock protein HslJ
MKESMQKKQVRFLLLLLMLAVGLTLVGCSSGDSESGDAVTTDPNRVTNIVWEWETFKVKTGYDNEAQRPIQETSTIPDPENYTLILREDGTFSGKADCNEISGTYSSEGGYSFTMGPSTMAFCGEDSLDQQYLDLLSRIVAGGPDGGGGFALETPAGDERMEFRNGGATQTQ